MGQIIWNGAGYFIEFVKLMLAVRYVLGYKMKKQMIPVFAASLCGILLLSVWVDISEFTLVFGALSIGIVAFYTSGKKRGLKIILCFIGISIVDMAIGSLVFFFMNVTMQKVYESGSLILLLNSVSLLLIGIYALMVKRIPKKPFRISNKMTPVYLAAGFFLAFFITVLQFVELGEDLHTYRFEFVIGLNASVIIFVIIFLMSNKNQNENERLKLENKMNQNMLEFQRDYYLMLLNKEAETKAFRHDIREQISCIRLLYEKGEYEELGRYISEIEQATLDLSPKYNTGNDFVNAIINDLTGRFETVNFQWEGKMPPLKLSYMDTCTLFYNLLKNAFEAADKTEEKKVKAVVKTCDSSIVILAENSFAKIEQSETGELISTKEEKGHGYGVGNIRQCVNAYHGSYQYRIEGRIFVTEIILPDVVRDEKKNERLK
ncbi:GHKL domain-containing protein [Lachnospiraceae bacterium 38-14]